MENLKEIVLEMTLKPFHTFEQERIETVCKTIFSQWMPLLRHANRIGVMLWVADGSEILEYRGDLDEKMEWAHVIGGANQRMDWNKKTDPDGLGLHTRYYPYQKEIPVLTYRALRNIIATLRRIGEQMTGRPVEILETFDPGPEFAKSDFKYRRHNEICKGESMGHSSMVCCYQTLHEDHRAYAGFPDGIPEGTPVGTFLGRQAQIFLKDLGFEGLWLSNGFGFGTEAWGMTGSLFDGKRFYPEKADKIRQHILKFWELFRKECSFPLLTRGTNNTLGIDYATDGVDHKSIYSQVKGILPPPNSPWAALNGDFGLELTGYLSRIAELPGDSYLFRFYAHDPWWMNSPWIDRYEGEPHDIYLPLTVGRLDEEGKMQRPEILSLLTVDNSLGDLPESVPNECIPHLLKAYESFPDEIPPFLWVYPFREYSDVHTTRLSKPFFEDRLMSACVQEGLPLSAVVSTDRFVRLLQKEKEKFKNTIIVTPVPLQDSPMNDAIRSLFAAGGRLMLYGSWQGADPALMRMFHLRQAQPLMGNVKIQTNLSWENSAESGAACFDPVWTDGGAETAAEPGLPVLMSAISGTESRALACAVSDQSGGKGIWTRGFSDQNGAASFGIFFRKLARLFGYRLDVARVVPESRDPIMVLGRRQNAVWISGYCPDTTVELQMQFPLGAPLLFGTETTLSDGCAIYHMPRAWHKECRVFVRQRDGGVLHCTEQPPVSYFFYRRFEVGGLDHADVYILPKSGYENDTELLLNSVYPYFISDPLQKQLVQTELGPAWFVRDVTGRLMVSERHQHEIPPREEGNGV